jgi:hypothetical protein
MLGHVDGRMLRWYLDRRQAEAVVAPRFYFSGGATDEAREMYAVRNEHPLSR